MSTRPSARDVVLHSGGLVRSLAERSGVRVAGGRGVDVVRLMDATDAVEIRIAMQEQLHRVVIGDAVLDAAQPRELHGLLKRAIERGAHELRASALMSLLDRERPIDFSNEGDRAERATRAEQAAARLLEESARVLRQAAVLRGEATAPRADVADIARDAALEGRSAAALAVIGERG